MTDTEHIYLHSRRGMFIEFNSERNELTSLNSEYTSTQRCCLVCTGSRYS